jgi:hypothetical protein
VALLVLLPVVVVAGASGILLASSGGLLTLPPAGTPAATASQLVGPSGPLATAGTSAAPPGSPATGGSGAPPTLVPPGTPATSVGPSAPPPSGPAAPPPSIQRPSATFTDQGTFRGDLRATGGEVALETLAKLAGPKSIVAQASTLTFTSSDPWIPVTGQLDEDGRFVASGTGTYAGVEGVRVEFQGRLTAQLLVGSYEVGVGGGLPGGTTIIDQFSGARIDPPPQPMPEPIASFLARYAAAVQAGDAETLLALLHPVVIERYGVDQCRAELTASNADPTFAISATAVTGPGTWLYTADGTTSEVRDAYTVTAMVTAIGVTDQRFLHFGWVDGGLRWFTDCGTPTG